jgi:hypothetical protein
MNCRDMTKLSHDMTTTDTYTQGRPLPMGQPGQSEQLAPIHKNLQKKM